MLNKPILFTGVLPIVVGLLLPGSAVAQNYPRSVSELVANTKAQIKTIDMATFKAALDKSDLGLIVDVREPGEYADGHIPGAINIPRGQIEFRIWPHVGFPDHTNMSKKMTLYCGSGARCALATKSLQDLGFSNATAVDMRIEDWITAGYPLVKK
jgi:rhodanese-related sulfurtransferase